jgi:hypothetical protein
VICTNEFILLYFCGLEIMMTDKDFNKLMELAEKLLRNPSRTKEEALPTFVAAGILDENGDFTQPYRHLAKAVVSR